MNERRTTQPFGPFFPLIFTVAKWICRLLHPVTVQGLENLPRHGALLVGHAAQRLKLLRGHLRQRLRHEQAAVRCEAADDRLRSGNNMLMISCAVVVHIWSLIIQKHFRSD